MNSVPSDRTRLTVVSGFLGSGKTTWLRHQLHEGRFAGAHIVVNEAAAAPVDDALLADLAEVTVIAGGCACCDRRDAFLATLLDIVDAEQRRGTRGGEIVLETSGLAAPAALIESIRQHPVLAHHITLDEVIVLVDAEFGLANLAVNHLIAKQVEAADTLIVTKVDTANSTLLADLCGALARLNPGASLSGAASGTVHALPDFDPRSGTAQAAASDDPRPVVAAELALDPNSEWAVFSVWLSALLHARGDDIYRVKGVVRTPAGRVLLQCVQKAVLQPRILPSVGTTGSEEFDNRLAVIGRGFDGHALQASLRKFGA